jgi:Putative zinc-finger
MSCPFGHDDAAYVLGALSTSERLQFEKHLAGCEDCTRSVCELAGIPGLLSRIDSEVLTVLPADEAVPESLLPGLARAARRSRRRRVLGTAGAAAAVTALVASVGVSQLGLGDDATAPGGGTEETMTVLAMNPVGEVPVQADLAMESVTWGTRLELTCTYDTGLVTYELPPAVDYVIVLRTEDGRRERVGSWRSVDGRTMQLTAGTAVERADISWVQVRTPDGRVVLHSTA